MAKTIIGLGIVLIVIGIVAYVGTGGASITALIPTFLGIIVTALGVLASRPRTRAVGIGGAAAVGLLGLLGSFRGVQGLMTMLTGGVVERPAAVLSQASVVVIGVVLIGIALWYFLGDRRQQQPSASPR